MFDDPVGFIALAVIYLGESPNSPSARELADVEKVLSGIRSYVRNFETSGEIGAMANGDICMRVP